MSNMHRIKINTSPAPAELRRFVVVLFALRDRIGPQRNSGLLGVCACLRLGIWASGLWALGLETVEVEQWGIRASGHGPWGAAAPPPGGFAFCGDCCASFSAQPFGWAHAVSASATGGVLSVPVPLVVVPPSTSFNASTIELIGNISHLCGYAETRQVYSPRV